MVVNVEHQYAGKKWGEREPSKVELIGQTKEVVSTIRKRLQTGQRR